MIVIKVEIPESHIPILQTMIPFYGETPGEVIRFIILMWFHQHISKIQMRDKKGETPKVASVEIPPEMINGIEEIIKEEGYLGFESLEEFAREAMRASIMKYSGYKRKR